MSEKYVTILDSFLDYDISSTELMIYSIIYGFTQSGQTFRGSYEYLKKWCKCNSDTTIWSALNNLIKKGLIQKTNEHREGNINYCEYIALSNIETAPLSKNERPLSKNETTTFKNWKCPLSKNERDNTRNTYTSNNTKDNNICTTTKNELSVTPTKYVFPCKPPKSDKNKTQWVLSQEDLNWYLETYPNLDINLELRKAWKWLKDNQLKTYTGMNKYISGWLARANDKTPSKKEREIKIKTQEAYIRDVEYRTTPKSVKIINSFEKLKENLNKNKPKETIIDVN